MTLLLSRWLTDLCTDGLFKSLNMLSDFLLNELISGLLTMRPFNK
jgi:hypothetical protein